MIPIFVHQFFTYGIFGISLLTNATFILVATTTKSDQIGRYRYLMILFAVTDVLVSITHLILMPSVQIALDGYIFFGLHLIDMPAYMGVWAGKLFVVFFYQTFIILAFHYIYRYAVVCETIRRSGGVPSLCSCNFYTFGYDKVVQTGFMPSAYKTEYYRPLLLESVGIHVKNVDFGYLAIILRKPSDDPSEPDVWQMDAVVAIFGAVALFGFTAVVISVCSFLILRKLRIAQSSILSNQMRATQHQLLKALIVQTVIPSIFSYIPLATIFLVPCMFFDLRGIFGDLLIILTAVFPALDPIIMLYFVKSYRNRIKHIWRDLAQPLLMTAQVSQASDFTTGSRHSAA